MPAEVKKPSTTRLPERTRFAGPQSGSFRFRFSNLLGTAHKSKEAVKRPPLCIYLPVATRHNNPLFIEFIYYTRLFGLKLIMKIHIMNTKSLISLSLILFLLLACNNDDNSVTEADRAEALLGQWAYEAIMTDSAVDINGDGQFNIYLYNTQEIRQCIKDNLTFFTERGTGEKGDYSINDNGLACEEDGQFTNIEEDRYELVNNNTIRFDIRNEMRIIELTKTKLVVETDDNLGGENVIVTITYGKS